MTLRTFSMSKTARLPSTAWSKHVTEHFKAQHASWIRLVRDPQSSHSLRFLRTNRYSTLAAWWTYNLLIMTWRDSPHSKIEIRSGTSMKAMLKVSSMPSTMSVNRRESSRTRRYLSSSRNFRFSKIRRQRPFTQIASNSIIWKKIKIKTWIMLMMRWWWWRREI